MRHVIRAMRRYDLTNQKTKAMTMTKTMAMAMTKTNIKTRTIV